LDIKDAPWFNFDNFCQLLCQFFDIPEVYDSFKLYQESIRELKEEQLEETNKRVAEQEAAIAAKNMAIRKRIVANEKELEALSKSQNIHESLVSEFEQAETNGELLAANVKTGLDQAGEHIKRAEEELAVKEERKRLKKEEATRDAVLELQKSVAAEAKRLAAEAERKLLAVRERFVRQRQEKKRTAAERKLAEQREEEERETAKLEAEDKAFRSQAYVTPLMGRLGWPSAFQLTMENYSGEYHKLSGKVFELLTKSNFIRPNGLKGKIKDSFFERGNVKYQMRLEKDIYQIVYNGNDNWTITKNTIGGIQKDKPECEIFKTWMRTWNEKGRREIRGWTATEDGKEPVLKFSPV